FLMPMWLVSGAFFPGDGSGWLMWIIRLNPLTYGVAGLRRLMYTGELKVTDSLPSMTAALLVTIVFTAAWMLLAVQLVRRPSAHNVS
ncbi:MAG: ABC transporter permease, partial [Planctomycetaceae bacterium]|nr:ABC transporter permease [Planctomycetaceae bacterium]